VTANYVVGIDSSTQSVKAIAWTADGRAVGEARAPLEVATPAPLHVEQDARSWWDAATIALRELTKQIDPSKIDGIAIANQRETIVFLDRNQVPLAPATLWMDRRAREMTAILADQIGADRLHEISGKPLDVIACIYRLAWYRKNQPDLLSSVSRIADVQSYLVSKLTGQFATAWTSADPSGIFDIGAKQWSRELLDYLGLHADLLPTTHRPGALLGTITDDAAAATHLAAGTPVYAAGGDGQCAALGAGATSAGTLYLNLGTALVGGLWSPTSELSNYWRTLVSPTGDGYLLETVQKAGTYLVDWLLNNFSAGGTAPANFDELNARIAKLPIGSDGVVISPYLVGCMDPHWDADASATITGLRADHTIAHLYRAALEAMTVEFDRAQQQMRDRGLRIDRIMAIGGGAENGAWLQMIADATGVEVVRCHSNQASSLGAAITAAVGAGWFASFNEACAAMVHTGQTWKPDVATRDLWSALSQRQERIYESNKLSVPHPAHTSGHA
jgi:xylulokinase